MKFSFKKSFKMGPTRFNLSKKGLGISTGVKGLRIGVSNKGSSYISSGSQKIYLKNNTSRVSSTMNKAKDNESQMPSKDKYKQRERLSSINLLKNIKKIKLVSYKTVFFLYLIVLIFFPLLFEISILAYMLAGICVSIATFIWIKKYKKSTKATKTISEIQNIFKEKGEDEAVKLLKKMNVNWDDKFKEYIYLQVYLFIIPILIKEFIIDENKKIFVEYVKRGLKKDILKKIDLHYFHNMLVNFMENDYLDEKKEKIISNFFAIFDIPSNKVKDYKSMLNYYKELRILQQEDLKYMKPSMKIPEEDCCYYESSVKLLKNKIIKSYVEEGIRNKIKSLTKEDEGKIFITKNTIHFILNGHKKIKLENIIDIISNTEEGIIELIVMNRQKPVYLSTEDTTKTFIIMEKALYRVRSV